MSKEHSIRLLAHNIRSLWNVGSFFRTGDAFGVERIYLTGYTATPPRREITKTAIGAEEWIPWEYCKDSSELIAELKKEGWRITALEQSERSVDFNTFAPYEKTLLVVGHEILGIPKELLDLCDDVVEIPMHGKKESLNVSVAAGIALNHMRNEI